MRKLLPAILIVLAILALESSGWGQCSMCRTALESSPEGKFLASSFAHGILMLLFLPYIIFGTIATVVVRAYRKKSKDQL
ncbi:MAG: hypothetical protein DMG11_30615 [Acidobacteria bacterium]|nr:MAG: hypothetical protein DMG11_30615 [Acidobacteriota bacterium]